MKRLLETIINKLTEYLVKWFVPWAAAAFLAIVAYVFKTGADKTIKQNFVVVLASLIGLTVLSALSWLRIYLKYGWFLEAYGVYWDRNHKMRCMSCKKPLKHSTIGPEIFFCSDPQCNSKYVLKDDLGQTISKETAINGIERR